MTQQGTKILYLTKYSRNAGSSRLRSFQYFPFMEIAGFEIEVSPLFSKRYLEQLYSGKSTAKEAVKGYANRFAKLFTLWKFNTIVIEKELFPYLPAFAEQLLSYLGIRYIVDYDDAIYHNYDQNSNPLVKMFLGKKIDAVMRYASIVVAGNSYLAERAEKAGAKKIKIIPTVIDLLRYPEGGIIERKPPVLGWIGTKSTFEKHVVPLMSTFQKAVGINAIEFHIVGVTSDIDYGVNIKFFPWQEESEVEMIQRFSIGIMPLQDSLWEKGKCSYKLIQYMACGKPIIASPVGMNNEVIMEGVNGFAATNDEEWLQAINTLVADEEKRKAFGEVGRQLIEERFSLQVTAPQWIRVLKEYY